MHKYLPIVVPLLPLVLLTLACNGDGGTPATPGASPGTTPGETPTSGPIETPTQQPSPTDIEDTPGAGDTPTIEPTPPAPAASPIPVGTPAIAPADLSLYEGMAIDQEECLFDPRTALANCPNRGLYSVEPPLTGEDISCSVLIVAEEPVVLLCRSQEPQQSRFYTIQGAAP